MPENIHGRFEGGFLKALLHDAAANTIAIGAAAMVPLLAMVGGAVDASRFYMAETRLQAACDAGALAARRAMADDNFTEEDRQIGENFFDQNYEEGMFGMTNGARTFSATESGEVNGVATGIMPTSLMGIFGFGEFNMRVECTADINISNTDIMFVIDVTGSMNCAPDNPGGGNCGNDPDPGSKIEGLQNAMMLFFDTVEESTSPSAQVRYGVVPYSSNVNVGAALVAADPSWMADDAVFQSRWAKWDEGSGFEFLRTDVIGVTNRSSETYIGVTQDVVTGIGRNNCENNYLPDPFTDQIRTDLGTHQGQNSQRVEGNFRYTNYDDDNETLWRGEPFVDFQRNSGGSSRTCTFGWRIYEYRGDIEFEIVEEREGPAFEEWIYAEIDTANPPGGSNPAEAPPGWEAVNLRTLYDSTPTVEVPIGTDGAMTTVTWDGCVEEADTVATTTFYPNIPDGALDMNINLVPNSQATRWKPVIRELAWERRDGSNNRVTRDVGSNERSNQSRPGYDCATPAFRLREMERDEMQTFVDSLYARGSTYHDIGMLWGGRFISPKGIFASANSAAPNGDAIARHIVFMTDGILSPSIETYGMYGVEWWGRRVSGNANGGRLSTAHAERFQAACRLARQENISVWVVAFGTELSTNLVDCASPGRAFVADDSAELSDRFREIAQRIAALRLTQ